MQIQQVIAGGALDNAVLAAEEFLDEHPELKKLPLRYDLVRVKSGLRLSAVPLEPIPEGFRGHFFHYEGRLNRLFTSYMQQQFQFRQDSGSLVQEPQTPPWYMLVSFLNIPELIESSARKIEVLTHPQNGNGLLRVIGGSTGQDIRRGQIKPSQEYPTQA